MTKKKTTTNSEVYYVTSDTCDPSYDSFSSIDSVKEWYKIDENHPTDGVEIYECKLVLRIKPSTGVIFEEIK